MFVMEKIHFAVTCTFEDNITMYGLESRCGDKVMVFPALSSDKFKIEEFISLLERNDFPFEILGELVEDFIEGLQ